MDDARPEVLSALATSEPAPQVVFRAGGALHALPLESVREVVVPRPPFARVPRAAAAVRGAMNLRGRVVAVVDLAAMLGLAGSGGHPGEHVIILDRGRRALGFLVGPVLGVEPLSGAAALSGAPAAVRGRAPSARHGADVVLLDPDVLEGHATALFAPLC